jgi:hypothetical protein
MYANDRKQRLDWFWDLALFLFPVCGSGIPISIPMRQSSLQRFGQLTYFFLCLWSCLGFKSPVQFWMPGKSLFSNRNADRDLYLVAVPAGIPSDLPARFAVSGSSIRDVGNFCDRFFVLHCLPEIYRVGDECNLRQGSLACGKIVTFSGTTFRIFASIVIKKWRKLK